MIMSISFILLESLFDSHSTIEWVCSCDG